MIADSDNYFLQCPDCLRVRSYVEGVSVPEKGGKGLAICFFCSSEVTFLEGLPFHCSLELLLAKYNLQPITGGLGAEDLSRGVHLLIACTALESMFRSLTIGVLEAKEPGLSEEGVRALVPESYSHAEMLRLFTRLCGKSLGTAFKECDGERFYDTWEKMRKDRNVFVHDKTSNPTAEEVNRSWERINEMFVIGVEGMIALHNHLIGKPLS